MRRSFYLVVVGILAGAPMSGYAQIYKCKGPDGRVQYTQGGCAQADDTKVVTPTIPQTSGGAPANVDHRGRAQQGVSASERQVTTLVAEALAKDDFRRAEGLAVNVDHWKMIEDARAARRAEAASRAANRPRVCSHSGYVHPGGAVSGVSVCR